MLSAYMEPIYPHSFLIHVPVEYMFHSSSPFMAYEKEFKCTCYCYIIYNLYVTLSGNLMVITVRKNYTI